MRVKVRVNFENIEELMTFFETNKDELIKSYRQQSKNESSKSLFRLKSYAHSVAKDFITCKKLKATDCQINKLAEIIVLSE